MTTETERLQIIMDEAVEKCIEHVDAGGLPFVGVLVDETGVISEYGVNQVRETGDPTAHAEIVAMRSAMVSPDRADLARTVLLATGEPCGLCYRFAIDHGVDAIYVAVDRDDVAKWCFDYRRSYSALGITERIRAEYFRALPVARGTEPLIRYQRTITHYGR